MNFYGSWIDNRILDVMEHIKAHDKGKVFAKEVQVIDETTYKMKGAFDLFKGFNTAWGKRYVLLMSGYKGNKGFFECTVSEQAAMLIHEATHQLDIERMGYVQFYGNYITQLFENRYRDSDFEIRARMRENTWRAMVHLPLTQI